MPAHNLSTLTQKTIANYRDAAEYTVKAYRVGGHRLAGAISSQLDDNLFARTEKVLPTLSGQVQDLQGRLFRLTGNGIDMISDQTIRFISVSAKSVASGVGKVAQGAAEIDAPYLTKGLGATAQLALTISVKFSEGAESLLAAVAGPVGKRVQSSARKAARATQRKVKTEVKGAKTAARKATRQVASTKAKVVRKVRVAAAEATA